MTDSLRPLTSRALTSAMDVLRPVLTDSRVLDLYAGLGRFSKSALEEGAESVTLVEKDRKIFKELSRIFDGLKATLICRDALEFLRSPTQTPFDIVFADPPFDDWKNDFQTELFQAVTSVVTQGSIFLVKHPKRVIASDSVNAFRLYKTSIFGDSRLLYYKYG